jgi:hypothetical protein
VADAQVHKIEPGSLIVLKGVDFEGVELPQLMDGLERACGHRKFIVLQIEEKGGDALIFGPDELVGWLRVALGIDLELAPVAPTPKDFDLGRVEFTGEAG